MSKKNSSVNLKKIFEENKDFNKIYTSFKKNLNQLKPKKALIAVSGGPDSLSLVALSKRLSLEKNIKFYYVLVNHNIRKNSLKEGTKVKRILKKNNTKLVVISNKKKITKNIQSEARSIRYKILLDYCLRNRINLVLTAHNLEDQIETFFIRLSRGSGLTGLSAMQSKIYLNSKVKLFRPLLDTKKKFLLKITKKVFGNYIQDPSNRNFKFLRTKIRSLKIPLKKSGIHYDKIIQSIKNLSSSKTSLDQYLLKLSQDIIKKNKKTVQLDTKKFNELNLDMKIQIINHSIKLISKNYYNPRSKKVQSLIGDINSDNFSRRTLGGCLISKNEKGLIIIEKEKKNR